LLTGCTKKVEKIQPLVSDITESVYGSGIVKARNQYQVYPAVSGVIEKIILHEGALVKTGDAIMQLRNDNSRLTASNARLAAAYADLKNNSEKIEEQKANTDLLKSKMQNDSLLWVRQKKLFAENVGSQVELEQRELNYKNSAMQYQTALLHLMDLTKQLAVTEKQSKNNLQISASAESDFTIKSHINGRIYDVARKEGEFVSPQTAVATIGSDSSFYLELQIDEYDITRIKLNQKIAVTMDSYKGKTFEAIVTKINPIMNDRSRSFTVEAVFTQAPPTLFPNLTAEANIIISVKKNILIIPRIYLIKDSFVLSENKDTVPVVVGLKDYNSVEIMSGINKNQFILKPGK
jgi:multidrug resistance efflux pump